MRHLNTGNHRPNHIHKPGRFPIAQRTGTFVPLPTPLCGRRMPARKSPEGPSRSTSSTVPLDNINALHTRPSHIGRVLIWPARVLTWPESSGALELNEPLPRPSTQDEHPKRSFLVRLSPSKLRKIRGARLMKNPGLRLAKFGASVDSPARIQYD